jgi:hypothetical protein
MNAATTAYLNWYTKLVKNLGYTKGFEAKCLLKRFEAASEPRTDLEAAKHAQHLCLLFDSYSKEQPGLRWLAKSREGLSAWQCALEAMLYQENDLTEANVIEGLLQSSALSVDEAINLMQVTDAC